jgi:ABC-type multidrug transport system ATPase subunit
MYVEEVAELVELIPLRGALVGLPGVNGLSTEQRKRLTIAVELVANPSIIFMDEPTSGLDATAAAIVMRAVRNTVDTGRTVVCTIHQPSIDIFEAFDEVSSINDEKIVEVILEPVLSLRLQAVLELL